ncbi:MAG: flagellar basal body-associated protein FliL [Clostridiales bacterium]|nr:flagellar basal body-associated protein FliL [Clostridiales bacterium]
MKKNILTIIILAIVLINAILTGVLIFVIVPASNKTTRLVNKVAQVIELELEETDKDKEISVADLVTYKLDDELTVNLKKSSDGQTHYALVPVSLSMNSKHPDYEIYKDKMGDYEGVIKEIIADEIQKHTNDEVLDKKNEIKNAVLTRLHEYFKSDFISNVNFGNMVVS